ncbi:MAG: hydroxylamine reductase [Deltaproteobacteria bacterium]|jgi:hydroxylamine reductase|nr:hydroxylamine reductase [Deltaproteobacteria bacterium]
MFCFQCEETQNGSGCVKVGVCGKSAEVAGLSDLLIQVLKELAAGAKWRRTLGTVEPTVSRFLYASLYATLTNVNFDPASYAEMICQAASLRDQLFLGAPASQKAGLTVIAAKDPANLAKLGEQFSLGNSGGAHLEVVSARETALYGLKGLAAYLYHADKLGYRDEALWAFGAEVLALALDRNVSVEEWVSWALKVGEANFKAMELLDKAHTETFGHPEPTKVSRGFKPGPAILVSGHDLKELASLLEQTKGQGVNVYTHGEMLPAHAYPGLKADHLVGHYGTAWPNQVKEFVNFPGAIVFNSNCLKKPDPSYIERTFTTGMTGWPGVEGLNAGQNGEIDFTPVINAAKKAGGFTQTQEGPYVLTGWGHNAVIKAAAKIIDLVQRGLIKRFILVGGCDGAKGSRSYYRELVQLAPKDTLILTLACGKFRFIDLDLGDIEGVPRLLDIGQCNDAFSAVKIALALSEAFQLPINDLPLSLVLSWYEQKACAILLSLLHLGVKNIRLGPTPPAFIQPGLMAVLAKEFKLTPITNPKDDLAAMLQGA